MESTEKSKYEQMLSQYDIALKDSDVAAKVAAIVEKCLRREYAAPFLRTFPGT